MTDFRGGPSFFGHLGNRTSALLDGQLSEEETARAWAHVQVCHSCRDRVEREGWVKRRLAGLCAGEDHAPEHLKGSLLQRPPMTYPCEDVAAAPPRQRPGGAWAGLAAVGGGAVGAAVVGLLVLSNVSEQPTERRAPVTSVSTQSPSSGVTPTSVSTQSPRSGVTPTVHWRRPLRP